MQIRIGAVGRLLQCVFQARLLAPLMLLTACGGGSGNPAAIGVMLAASTTASPAPASHGAPPVRYRVVQISGGANLSAALSEKGHVAFSDADPMGGDDATSGLYDGSGVRAILPLAGSDIRIAALNIHDKVVGVSTSQPDNAQRRAFRWTPAGGTRVLSVAGFDGESQAYDVNDLGQVVGQVQRAQPTQVPVQAVLWSAQGVPLLLGRPDLGTVPFALNAVGQVAGVATQVGGVEQAFRWTAQGGLQLLGVIGIASRATLINDHGLVAGTNLKPSIVQQAFVWSASEGMIDLGAMGEDNISRPTGINEQGQVVGGLETPGNVSRAFLWTRQGGMRLLGTLGGDSSFAYDIDEQGRVVGIAALADGTNRPFYWTAQGGMIDLATRVDDAPAGLQLYSAYRINERGEILVMSNTGLVLLVPVAAPPPKSAPVVGPIAYAGNARINVPLALSARFTDADLRDTHTATWSWGDGSQDAGIVREGGGKGSVSGRHAWRRAGLYKVRLSVTDSGGKRTTVERTVVVCAAGAWVVGEGAFDSPVGATRGQPQQAGPASFVFVAGAARGASYPAELRFTAPGVQLAGSELTLFAASAGARQYRGSASLNGKPGYSVTLTVSDPAPGGASRVRLRVAHSEAGQAGEVVDYDNGAAQGATGTGSLVFGGAFTSGS